MGEKERESKPTTTHILVAAGHYCTTNMPSAAPIPPISL
jgi:hypothetical protein